MTQKFIENKRGQLFTILAILLISLMFLSFELFSFIHERGVIKTRVSTMDSFLKSIEDNLEKQIYIAGFRILFLAENYIIDNGAYIGDNGHYTSATPVLEFFNESFLNGTVAGELQPILFTYTKLADSLQDKADKINVNITLENPPSLISVTQNDAWHVNFTVEFNLKMEDKQGLARWDRVQSVSALIPIQGFSDPVYNVETHNKVPRLIKKTPYEVWDNVNKLLDHVENGYYAANSDAPSFLKRLEGDFDGDENGIESFVILPDLSQQGVQGLPPPGTSCVDHTYFNSPIVGSTVSVMPWWFRIDGVHKDIYCLGC